jgi:hypothetical protein
MIEQCDLPDGQHSLHLLGSEEAEIFSVASDVDEVIGPAAWRRRRRGCGSSFLQLRALYNAHERSLHCFEDRCLERTVALGTDGSFDLVPCFEGNGAPNGLPHAGKVPVSVGVLPESADELGHCLDWQTGWQNAVEVLGFCWKSAFFRGSKKPHLVEVKKE